MSRDKNRAEFPGLAQLMDTFRALYGDNVKLVHGEDGAPGARDDGVKIGHAGFIVRKAR